MMMKMGEDEDDGCLSSDNGGWTTNCVHDDMVKKRHGFGYWVIPSDARDGWVMLDSYIPGPNGTMEGKCVWFCMSVYDEKGFFVEEGMSEVDDVSKLIRVDLRQICAEVEETGVPQIVRIDGGIKEDGHEFRFMFYVAKRETP